MFVDQTRIRVTGGAGGNGCCSFRREKYVPRGGPNGGDGGNGGSVYFVASSRVSSLLNLKFHAHWKAKRGEHGQGKDRHGRTGADALIPVPPGTLVRDWETGEPVADLVEEEERFLAARGGRGGRGNARFVSSTNQAPRFAEKGEPGEDREYLLELKIIADVGLVGLPNAGKSTLLAAATAARPKIDSYPFTTLSPNLGVAHLSGHRTLTLADIPGIIEGAAEGKGLGHDFLRHIERTRVLLFLIDLSDPDPAATRDVLEHEVLSYSPAFADRPRVYVLNKADITENRARFDAVAREFDSPFLISGATGEGVPQLLEHLWGCVGQARRHEEEAEAVLAPPAREYRFVPPFKIEKTRGGYQVEGQRVLRAVVMTDLENEDAVRHLQVQLRRMGLYRALQRLGAGAGDTIHIGDYTLEYHPD